MKRIIIIIIAILMLSACRTTKVIEVPVETIKKEYIQDTRIDSIYIRDSIDRRQRGDTLYITKYHTQYKYKIKADTLIKIDTIPQIVEIPKIVTVTKEKKVEVNHIYWYQKLLMWVGGISLLMCVICITYKVKKK